MDKPDFEKKFNILGDGKLGGKASGLLLINNIIDNKIDKKKYPYMEICVPEFTVLSTSVFDDFISRNDLLKSSENYNNDKGISLKFQQGTLPVEIVGEIRKLVQKFKTPIAVRSSSMLEDSLEEPFAGVYETKMISNNSPFIDDRYRVLTEAIKFVYSSLFLKPARNYFKAIKRNIKEEKMAVIIQEVAGKRHYDRYYPEISGVARSYNYYPVGRSKPEQGVVQLALGLGKTIVDNGIAWNYSPAFPKISSPFSGISDILKKTQLKFWAVNMGHITDYDPTKETEYLTELTLKEAEYDNTIKISVSTYDSSSDRLSMGMGNDGVRILNFAPLLQLNEYGYNTFISDVLRICEQTVGCPVEIEFAMNYDKSIDKLVFYFLQLRPMFVSKEKIEIPDGNMTSVSNLLSSDKVLGNGIVEDIEDIVYVKKEVFDISNTNLIAQEIESVNKKLQAVSKNAVYMGFGRWGSTDRWLGIPVNWGQISAAKAIVEIALPDFAIELSQGSHFFHNLISFKVSYFSIKYNDEYKIDWDWLEKQIVIEDLKFVRHIKLEKPLKILVDGRKGRGIIKK
ncbi:MAG: hypothetical protein HY959_12185 [Ignavibacteriae bacterium]|nr:hypothetical protein [Ignavibacteriota bacterium]